ncbi:hypothetical protein RND81_13G179200 [Saponaria officinalis]|uniref:BHLH domain-containing protein n=1 Tax=Saponaria officinalis TaxID=3572 RepID=A0AAW1GZD2_SAPOF
MDMSSPKSNNTLWFPEFEDADDPMLMQELVGDYLVDYPTEDIGTLMDNQELQYTLSGGSECNSSTAAGEISNNSGTKRQKTGPSSPNNNSNCNAESNQQPGGVINKPKPTKRPRRLPDQCQNHIIAERQRRQNLSQRFIALSALIPGLKKMDKTSVLGEAISHMKELKERVTILEDENARRAVESVVVVQRSRVIFENESNSSTSNDSQSSDVTHGEQLPEVEARFSNKSVLIKIHCQMRSGVLSNIINQIESLNLLVTNTSSMPFNNTVDITIMTQMEPDFDMMPQEVVANLRSIF